MTTSFFLFSLILSAMVQQKYVLYGIALNTLHDKAVGLGLITFDDDLWLVCAPSLRDDYTNETVSLNFKNIEGKLLALPAEAAGPKPEYLEWHREHVFGRW